jgi:hypothetical protein
MDRTCTTNKKFIQNFRCKSSMDETTWETSIEMNNIVVNCGRLGCEDVD